MLKILHLLKISLPACLLSWILVLSFHAEVFSVKAQSNNQVVVPTKQGSSDPNSPNVIRAESSIKIEQVADYYDIQISKGDRVALVGNSNMCQQFHELTFTAKNALKGKIRIKELQDSNREQVPVKNKDSIVFKTCSIDLEGIKSADLENILLSSTYPKSFVDKYAISTEELKFFTSYDYASNLDTKFDVTKTGDIEINSNEFGIYQTLIPTLPINFVLAPADSDVTLEVIVGSTDTNPGIVAGTTRKAFIIQVAKLVGIGILISVAMIAGAVVFKRRQIVEMEEPEKPKDKRKPVFW
jgi:hypothetical protein